MANYYEEEEEKEAFPGEQQNILESIRTSATSNPTPSSNPDTQEENCPKDKNLSQDIEGRESPIKKQSSHHPLKRKRFQFGNYDRYYGYRNKDHNFQDIRLTIFQEYRELFHDKEILDIGCNSGELTMSIADQFEPKHITGLDIESSLITGAMKTLIKRKKSLPWENERKKAGKFPYNVTFVRGDYVLRDDVLLDVEEFQTFDMVLALSITKWIHLNYADSGLKQAFRRMYHHLRPKGILILEAQSFDSYQRRKHLSSKILANYNRIEFLPTDFDSYLLSDEVGFKEMHEMGIPEHCVNGFQRIIKLFYK